MSNNNALQLLYCRSNLLTTLNVSNNTALTAIWCSNNQLTNLDVSNNTALSYLNCCVNQITSISSFVANTGLGSGDYVDVSGNNLSCDDLDDILTMITRNLVLFLS